MGADFFDDRSLPLLRLWIMFEVEHDMRVRGGPRIRAHVHGSDDVEKDDDSGSG